MEFKTPLFVQALVALARRIGLFIFLSGFGFTINAQDKGIWHDKKCAVCLTYDDALNVHLDNVVPILDSLSLKGTFYLSGFFPAFRERVTEWKAVADKGHELGNHTLFHPCMGKLPGREWVKPDNEIDLYNVGAYVISGQSGEELIDLVKQATKSHALIVFLFHGVGGEHSLDLSLNEHRKLLHFLKQNEKDIWIAPFIDIAEYVKEHR